MDRRTDANIVNFGRARLLWRRKIPFITLEIILMELNSLLRHRRNMV